MQSLSGRSTAPPPTGWFGKADSGSVAFTKTGSGSLSLKAGTAIETNGRLFRFKSDTAVTMPTLSAGTDYAIYVCSDGSLRADANFSAPSGYTTANSRQIGGFHYGLIAPGTAIDGASGFSSFTSLTRSGTTTNGSAAITGLAQTSDLFVGLVVTGTGTASTSQVPVSILSVDSSSQVTVSANGTASGAATLTFANKGAVWSQAMVDAIAGINAYSLWDLKWRPACRDPRGMALVANRKWMDIYLCNKTPDVLGTSVANVAIGCGTSQVRIPALYGGNGSATYVYMWWYNAVELISAYGKDLPSFDFFSQAALGVIENCSYGSSQANTAHYAGFTSIWGHEQVTGLCPTWSSSVGGAATGSSWRQNGRGAAYAPPKGFTLGGSYNNTYKSGSRCLDPTTQIDDAGNNYAARGVSDHVRLP